MSPKSWVARSNTSRAPRVSGDEPITINGVLDADECSPRERG